MSYIKVSTDGINGSGKTCTMAQLAVGLAKEYCNSGAVHVYDSSDRWPAWKIHIFDVEKIPLVITAGNSLASLLESMDHFQQEKGAVYVGDDLTVPWMEGFASFAYENGSLPFDRRQQLINEWNKFVQPFQLGDFDAIACGRLGYHWENVEDPDSGEMKLMQGDSKFNAGGSQNFGYDCVLELEMRRRKRRVMGLLRGKTTMEYVCDVVKDANSIVNNQQFIFADFAKGYQKGDYKKVLDAFRPHIEFRRRLQPVRRVAGLSSKQLLVSGKTEWASDQAARKGYLEELDNLLNHCFPGGEKLSKLHTMFRHLTLEYLNGYMSWTRMEEEISTVNLRRNVDIVKCMRRRIDQGEKPTDQSSIAAILHLSTEDVLHPGHKMTLLELMTHQSIEAVKSKRGPQPVVAVMDRQAADEIAGD